MDSLNRKIVQIVILVSSIWLIISCSKEDKVNSPEGIRLEIIPSKDNYHTGERVWAKVVLINSSKTDYSLEKGFNFMDGIIFLIEDENGEKIKSKIVAEPSQYSGELLSGDSLFTYGELGWYFNDYQNYTGEYSINSIYQGVKSNTERIKFSNPEGNDKIVYEKMKEIDKKVRNSPKYLDTSLIDLENLFFEYPSSTYAPYLFNKITMSTGISAKEEERYNKLLNVFFENYSNSYESYYSVLNYEWYLKKVKNLDNENVRIKLEELSDKHKGTIVNEIIRNKFLNQNNKE